MNILMIIGLGALLAVIAVWLCLKIVKGTIMKVIVIGAAVVIMLGGSSIINLNYIQSQMSSAVQDITNKVGDTYIKMSGNTILVKVNNNWYDVSKLSIVGDFTKQLTLRYDGKDIYVGDSALVDVFKTLKGLGFIKSE